MRGKPKSQPPMFFAICVEDRVRPDHPLRPIKRMVDEELSRMRRRFASAYADTGRPERTPGAAAEGVAVAVVVFSSQRESIV